jgi:hypothetical protein
MKYLPIISIQEFNKLSKKEKRVVVAQDILARLEQDMFKPVGCYVNIDLESEHKTVQNVANNVPCEGCARGLMFMSYVGIVNDLPLSELKTRDINQNRIDFGLNKEKTLEIFSKKQLMEIELFYENIKEYNTNFSHQWYSQQARKWFKKGKLTEEMFEKSNTFKEKKIDRLKIIMNHIIDTKGRKFKILDL